MKWFRRRKADGKALIQNQDKLAIIEELRKSQMEWANAVHRLEWVVKPDEVDCAIYDLMAAEKKYEMLLRKAKQYEWGPAFIYFEREVI
ncbi:DUF2508 family protein [Paenibacillus sp. J2TS4]|uniref:DUF2508 family protein n=1 Tax=Paenibacillus sp. J2TS4 TaxID=2807194 RepID=UPI001AFE34E0|nr:DUF2508 family protein [Paenibacillus sp. J2TS4]GIP36704.1 hypothetical protein J2TS4_59140 [Paenibacillus sp. J2TS4]